LADFAGTIAFVHGPDMPGAAVAMRELHQAPGPFGLATLGKTLILVPLPLNASFGDPHMYTLLAQIARFMSPAPAPAGVARRLLESAEARAGHSPQQARELRRAAFAYLRVVR
jgi:hypothetical protein